MPTTYAHYKFGRDVISALPRSLQHSIENNRELYDIGLHGPDILFYYKVTSKNHVNAAGYHLHDQFADVFFRQAADIIKQSANPDAAQAYIYGFICHFALDSECHKYIEKMIQVSGISHAEIEMEFDRLLLTEDFINPVSYLASRHIHPTKKNAEIIAPFFDGITTEEVEKTLSSMISVHKLLLAPKPLKRNFLFLGMRLAGLYASHHGMVMSLEANPACQDYCRLLKKLYAGAVPLAAGLILKYQKMLLQNAALPERFHETFGPGEKWESLPL
ncbi:MAG: zinc dependent phospholipase C family protein [Ruminococcus sp.]|nr:zinc dependent phospholipase C family protein [Ruminococcus sp.]